MKVNANKKTNSFVSIQGTHEPSLSFGGRYPPSQLNVKRKRMFNKNLKVCR